MVNIRVPAGNTSLQGREVLEYLKSRTPVFHDSNIFFRDIQYGIQSMLRERGSRVRYPVAESLAREVIGTLERENVLVPLDRQTWRVNDLAYKTPQVKKPAPAAKASPAAGAAPRPPQTAGSPPATPGAPMKTPGAKETPLPEGEKTE